MSKKQIEKDRRARLDEMRRDQRAAERRKTLLFVGIAVVVGLAIVGAAAVPLITKALNDPSRKALTSFGVSAAAAKCNPPTDDKVSGSGDHIGPGTSKPNQQKVKYTEVPPSSGTHYVTPAAFGRSFYTERDRPPMEQLVHNLEHGYTVLWYDATVAGDKNQLQDLEDIADKIGGDDSKTRGARKFIVSAWDPAYGSFPAGKHIGMSHWSKAMGHRQLCGAVSGEVVEDFMKRFPSTDAPEPLGA